ncbi:MAG TPA: hypothetical protein VGF69_06535 [Thermoanaerobaculia bacterium]
MNGRLQKTGYLVTFFTLAAIAPVRALRDYDYFWHLAAGRWMHEHRVWPRTDPFGAASDAGPWIDGEWLFQALLYPLHAAAGVNGIVVGRALFIGALFTLLLWWTSRLMGSMAVAAGVCAVAWFGAVGFFSERPATFATGFALLAVWLALQEPVPRRIVLYALLTVVWINFHPSALLAPMIAGAVAVGRLRDFRRGFVQPAAAALALLVNPYGVQGVLAPQRLVHLVTTGPFVNREWQVSLPGVFPLLYGVIAASVVLVVWSVKKESVEWRTDLPRLLLLALFSAMAIRYLRNQALFYVTWPLLIAPLVPQLRRAALRRVIGGGAVAFMLIVLLTRSSLGTGINDRVLPVRATAQLQPLAPVGNVFAAGHFGGYLIWAFYPERRVVNDGRNELHKVLLDEYQYARVRPEAWRHIITKYRIASAVDAYQPPIDGAPASLVLYPRKEWALVGFDDAGMAFVRRDGRDLRGLGYEVLVPDYDGPSYPRELIAPARQEFLRARRLLGDDSPVLQKIAGQLR